MKSHSGVARRLLFAALLTLCTATALPETAPALYTVEIVVFRNGGTDGALPDTVAQPAVSDDGIEATPVATGKLNAAATKLRKGGLGVLAHAAWTQGPTAWNSHQGPSATQLHLGDGITGKIFLYRGEVLSLGMDLTVEDGGHRYRINEVRRKVKPDQIQYFDHPAVGVVAIVTPAAPG